MLLKDILFESVPNTDYGYWISPRGQIMPVKYEGHEDKAWDILETLPEFRGKDPDDYSLIDILLQRGYIRVVADLRKVEIEIGKFGHPSNLALKAAANIIREFDHPKQVFGINNKRFVDALAATKYISTFGQQAQAA